MEYMPDDIKAPRATPKTDESKGDRFFVPGPRWPTDADKQRDEARERLSALSRKTSRACTL